MFSKRRSNRLVNRYRSSRPDKPSYSCVPGLHLRQCHTSGLATGSRTNYAAPAIALSDRNTEAKGGEQDEPGGIMTAQKPGTNGEAEMR